MNISKEKKESFEAVVEPVIKWLNDHAHPHTHIVINTSVAELSEGVCVMNTKGKHFID
jgi:hypothetical protein